MKAVAYLVKSRYRGYAIGTCCLLRGPIVQRRPPAVFIADSLGLDFLNSIATPVDTPVDWLDSGDGLLEWLGQAKLVPAGALGVLKGRGMPGGMDKGADQARAPRGGVRGFVRKHAGRPLAPRGVPGVRPLDGL